MEKDANERYRHAHEFAAALRACLNELGVQRADTERPSRMDKSPGTAPGAATKPKNGGSETMAQPGLRPMPA